MRLARRWSWMKSKFATWNPQFWRGSAHVTMLFTTWKDCGRLTTSPLLALRSKTTFIYSPFARFDVKDLYSAMQLRIMVILPKLSLVLHLQTIHKLIPTR